SSFNLAALVLARKAARGWIDGRDQALLQFGRAGFGAEGHRTLAHQKANVPASIWPRWFWRGRPHAAGSTAVIKPCFNLAALGLARKATGHLRIRRPMFQLQFGRAGFGAEGRTRLDRRP